MSEIELQKQINQLAAAYDELKTREGPGLLVDYFATSTKVGWGSYTSSDLSYMRVGNLLYVFFYIQGVSNNVATTVTLPFTSSFGTHAVIQIQDAGANAFGRAQIGSASSTITFYADAAGAAWTASGTKRIFGQIVVPV